jgi:hypothetical protein
MYGYSDDLVESEGIEGCDEFNAYSSSDIVARFHVISAEGQLEVNAIYGKNGCWGFAVLQVDEDVPLPTWPIFVTQATNSLNENGPQYSTLLEINCPDDAKLVRVDKED